MSPIVWAPTVCALFSLNFSLKVCERGAPVLVVVDWYIWVLRSVAGRITRTERLPNSVCYLFMRLGGASRLIEYAMLLPALLLRFCLIGDVWICCSRFVIRSVYVNCSSRSCSRGSVFQTSQSGVMVSWSTGWRFRLIVFLRVRMLYRIISSSQRSLSASRIVLSENLLTSFFLSPSTTSYLLLRMSCLFSRSSKLTVSSSF